MVIYKYFSTVDVRLPNVCPETIKNVNNQIQKIQEKGEKRGEYPKTII